MFNLLYLILVRSKLAEARDVGVSFFHAACRFRFFMRQPKLSLLS